MYILSLITIYARLYSFEIKQIGGENCMKCEKVRVLVHPRACKFDVHHWLKPTFAN